MTGAPAGTEIAGIIDKEWLDGVVVVQRYRQAAMTHLGKLQTLVRRYLDDDAHDYVENERVEAAMNEDGSQWRLNALKRRRMQLDNSLDVQQKYGVPLKRHTAEWIALAAAALVTLQDTERLVADTLTAEAAQ